MFVSLAEPQGAFTFKPKFTYPIFGEAEQIFGYKDLRIDLAFDCKSLKPFLNYKFSDKLSSEAKDINKEILPFLPDKGKDAVLKNELEWLAAIDKEDFQIPGECVSEYCLPIDTKNVYRIYKFRPFNDINGLWLHRRMQIFVLLFIEAGSYIDETDPVWEVYCIYKCPKDGSKETFVGFTTTYGYWKYPGHKLYDASDDKIQRRYRKKISQFIVLPPFQGKHHGQNLYKAVVDEWLRDPSVEEITVEDPSEEFDDLRDRCDMERLLFERSFMKDLKKLPISNEWMGEKRKQEKMVPRQFDRCVEMGLVYLKQQKQQKQQIENFSEKEIRLFVKKRLFQKNRDALAELEKADMRDKLQTAYQRIRDDYVRILSRVREVKKENKRRVDEYGDDGLATKKRVKMENN
ncbi:hypothetical protein FOA43_002823 [Brettanomyces nanus]|uniref:Histone acetyltransferase type B catalytic subunit n=1 Tax=Eeniella nana TaxID=13502 RepID=A0A875S3E4_EENNA|nr:uncharacterized protein FOA43_002823 [Brettanomyces nanus]QPG75468.1 hypothetical protein FOA43_002823 [Brettanomyces nanus]